MSKMNIKHLCKLISSITESALSVNPLKVYNLFFVQSNRLKRPYLHTEFMSDLAELTSFSEVKMNKEETDFLLTEFKRKKNKLAQEFQTHMILACVFFVPKNA